MPIPELSVSSSPRQVFGRGCVAAFSSVPIWSTSTVFMGVGAFVHDAGLNLTWAIVSTAIIFATPPQLIIISGLVSGLPALQIGLAVCLSAVRLLPMAASLLPLINAPQSRGSKLMLPAHFVGIAYWIELSRLLPELPREHRLAFANGLGLTYLVLAILTTMIGFSLVSKASPMVGAALLFLTPLAFSPSLVKGAHKIIERLALLLGVIAAVLLSAINLNVDPITTGVGSGTLAYAVGRGRVFLCRR
jgi:predicted branched-subunit amino acid permease